MIYKNIIICICDKYIYIYIYRIYIYTHHVWSFNYAIGCYQTSPQWWRLWIRSFVVFPHPMKIKNAFCVWKKLGLQSKYCTKLCCIEKLLPTQQTPTRSNCVSRMEIGLSPHIFQVSSRFRSLVFWCYNVGPPNVINWFITTMNYINPVTIYELFKRIINHTEFLEWFGPRTCKVVPPKWCERWFICHGN